MTAEQTKIAEESHVKAPWLNVYGVVPPHLDYPDCTMYEAVERCAETYPNHIAYVFMAGKPPTAPWQRKSTSAPGH